MSGRRPGLVIAVDGPAASGKGTISTQLAAALRPAPAGHGAALPCRGRRLQAEGRDLDDPALAEAAARAIDPEALDAEALGGRGAGELASRVAAHPQVRAALLDLQRAFAGQAEGAVLDGRDIGTVIAPAAPAKIFVTASPRVRAERRWRQLVLQDAALTLDEVLEDIRRRDERDSSARARRW
jgi:cytidylate kinase